jgi:hypothetical protein
MHPELPGGYEVFWTVVDEATLAGNALREVQSETVDFGVWLTDAA